MNKIVIVYIKNMVERKIFLFAIMLIFFVSGCEQGFLDEYPKDQLSEGTFWQSEDDALLALTGCYELERSSTHNDLTGWNAGIPYLTQWTDLARHKQPATWSLGYGYSATYSKSNERWSFNYEKIARCNYFLEEIEDVDMDSETKAEMSAEVKFLRAYCYYLLYQVYGGVPLASKILTFDEANTISRSSKSEVVSFVLNDLNEAITDLPISRPSSEVGRIEKGAALALKGRVLMSEERWSEAASSYKEIMDLDRYDIDPAYKTLFEDAGDNSVEVIWALRYMQDLYGEAASNYYYISTWYGGYSEMNIFQNFVDAFLMNDGKSIEESPLYDPENPFENRDPRLYATVFLPGYSVFKGRVFQGHPDSLATVGKAFVGHTGYNLHKFADSGYDGDLTAYGADFKVFRYAEVLLSYLECKLEAGDAITQSLLDETINKVRARAEVNMPPVSELETGALRDIVRNERLCELAFEGTRYYDLLRWKNADEMLNQNFYGMKLTDDPGSYDGKYVINDEGYLFSCKKIWDFEAHDYSWPIPQTELDINENLEQNTGY